MGITLLLWPTDFYFLSDQLIEAYIYWRSCTLLLTALGIVCLYFTEQFTKRYLTAFLVISLGIIGDFYTGLIFGVYAEPGSPWFHLVFLLPLYFFYVPESINNRILLAHVFLFTYYGAFILPYPEHWQWTYHGIALLLATSCSTLLAIGGHFYFRLIRRNYFQHRELEREREKSDDPLLNILPEEVSVRLKEGNDVSQQFEEVTVLCADIVDFTLLANNLSPQGFVNQLDEIFSRFDQEIQRDGL